MAMHFDLVDLRVFVGIAEEGSFTAGAERAHLSVPSASNRIRNLESSMGSRLLHRGAQRVSLTPEGDTFLHHARRVLEQAENLRDAMAQYTRGARGSVTVLANTTAATEFLPQDLRGFLSSHPGVKIVLKEQHNDEIIRAVSDGQAHIGVVVGSVHSASLDLHPYRTDRLVLAVSASHPLSARSSVPFADATEHDFIGMPGTSSLQTFVQREAIKLKKALRVRIEVGNYEAVCQLIAANAGVGVLPYSVAARYVAGIAIRIVEFEDSWTVRRHVLCTRSGEPLPAFARELLAHLSLLAAA